MSIACAAMSSRAPSISRAVAAMVKDHPQAKEQADYNLKYLVAVALLDDHVLPTQLQPRRIQAPDAQALLARVDVRPDEHFTARYPRELNARITIYTKDQ